MIEWSCLGISITSQLWLWSYIRFIFTIHVFGAWYKCLVSVVQPVMEWPEEGNENHLSTTPWHHGKPCRSWETCLQSEYLGNIYINGNKKMSGVLQLNSLIKELKIITKKVRHQEEADVITGDWKFAAAVMDRFLFWFFTLATVIASVTILFGAPISREEAINPLGE